MGKKFVQRYDSDNDWDDNCSDSTCVSQSSMFD